MELSGELQAKVIKTDHSEDS